VSGSGIHWAICKSALSSRQITTPAPHHSVFLQARCPSCRPTNSVKALKAYPLKALSSIGNIQHWSGLFGSDAAWRCQSCINLLISLPCRTTLRSWHSGLPQWKSSMHSSTWSRFGALDFFLKINHRSSVCVCNQDCSRFAKWIFVIVWKLQNGTSYFCCHLDSGAHASLRLGLF